MNALISVIIPVYNSENTIEKVLKSVVNQTYQNFEIIVVNDGSTDGSEKIIKEFFKLNSEINIRYYYQKNKGVSAARNFGLRNAEGAYIMFLDSDDLWVKDKIQRQLEIMKNNSNIDFLGANRDGLKLKSFFGVKFRRINQISGRQLLYKNYFMTSSVVFQREIIPVIGYMNETMSYSEDLEFFLRIASKFNCYLYNESLVYAVTDKPAYGHSGLSANLWKMERGELKAIKLGYKLGFVNFLEYCFISCFSYFKYIRRFIITKLR
ncbi:glycosyltransferase involved in cell wall biosynthesis [Winogradskyella epiphytica]|uniref:Glycosyltransferase involved in cell wall biosynthesis n=1 Tax=Winogradskyella epiphytica TaxID=262005 RepID=A0A2V4X073_9FLAO|nr:glycosyltransferase family 2 protein [Winogradskyella epiphytica]PYE83292.1 glycosyltransferase involved in cell wall biosynthesis [Winogradskyella epiphytica]GGW57097.1 hypothetical protein GCM10008085_05860 [Winogradskyella epiphytica]